MAAHGNMQRPVELSIVIPLFNEEENIPLLYERLIQSLEELGKSFEIILVDDASTDHTYEKIAEIAANDKRVKVLSFKRNFGQTAAIAAGIDFASGEILIPMDGDLQNDPEDIPLLLEKLAEGYDVTSGWRKHRKDRALTRVLPSKIANKIISVISGVHLHDYGCTLKAYRREAIKGVRLYGEMHRFIPIYAAWQGARVAEVVVHHNPRKFGHSKYGFWRAPKVFLDLIVVKFLSDYAHKPIYVFGGLGLLCFVGGFLSGLYAVFLKYFRNTSFIETPLPLLTVLLFVLGFSSILMGLLAEISIRLYYESQNKPTYSIREKHNLDEKPSE
jgi:glycosyltransferase involved in cell wall biosynthesis